MIAKGFAMSDTAEDTEIKFKREHYTLLKKCSDKKDMTEWNEFVKTFGFDKNQLEKVAHLEGEELMRALVLDTALNVAHLEGADLSDTHLDGAHLMEAHLNDTDFNSAHMEGAVLIGANLKRTNFMGAYMKRAHLMGAQLEYAGLGGASMEGASFSGAHMKGADLSQAHMEGVDFIETHMENVILQYATCDNFTLIQDCYFDKQTDFRGVALDTIQWSPGLKQLAEYINRRLNWIDWYKEHKIAKYPVRFFWECSDYGRCTQRILWTFTGLSLLFAGVYFMLPEILTGLTHLEGDDLAQPLYGRSLFWRSLYFSVVTMTTLGFGDIHANPQSSLGHGLLIFQVILGYVILGALVTRLSILFNSDGPSADFAKADSQKNWISRLKDWWKDGWGETGG